LQVSVVHAGRKSTGRLIDWAAFGIEDMFNPGGAILEEGVSERKEGEGQRWANLDAKLLVKGVGKLLIYCQVARARAFLLSLHVDRGVTLSPLLSVAPLLLSLFREDDCFPLPSSSCIVFCCFCSALRKRRRGMNSLRMLW